MVDFALTLPGVDPEKIALMGVSMGGYPAPRAAAFEKRISAVVADDGIYDFGVTQLAAIPPHQRPSFIAVVQEKDAPELDRKIEEALNSSPSARWGGDQAGFVMGEPTPHAVVAKMLLFNLRDGIAEQISCPALVLDAEEDMYLKGRPDELFAHLTPPKTMIRFTTAEGAGAHCQCGADRSCERPSSMTGSMTRSVSRPNRRAGTKRRSHLVRAVRGIGLLRRQTYPLRSKRITTPRATRLHS